MWLSFILFAPPQNSKNLEKSVGCRDPQTNETCRGPQELSPHLFALCSLQDPRETHLHPYRAHCRPASSSRASWVPTGRSTVDQTVLLTQHIEDSFETKKKAGAVFVDLTAAYDTVWHRGLTCKLLRLLPNKHMVQMIMELTRNRSFTLSIGDSKRSRLRRLRNGLPQGSVLAPLLFNIYTYDLLSTISQKYAYADDLAWMHTSKDGKTLEGTLSQDMTTLSAYLQTWRLKLSHTKTVTTAFHLNNREAKRELKIFNNGKQLPCCPTPTYLGVKLDRSLTLRHHLEALRKKRSSRVTLLRRLAGSGWDAGAKNLRTAALSLVYSTAEYCAPVWCCSAHTRLIDSVLNDALRIVTGCLRPTPTDYLPILAGIQPAELRRRGATLSLANRATLNPDHILHEQLFGKQNAHQGRLKSRRPFVPVAQKLLDSLTESDIRAAQWMDYVWNLEYLKSASRLHAFIPRASPKPLGMGLPRASRGKLNRLRTGIGRFHSSNHTTTTFLVDTDATVSVMTPSSKDRQTGGNGQFLHAANDSSLLFLETIF